MITTLSDIFLNQVKAALSDGGFGFSAKGYSPDNPKNAKSIKVGVHVSEVALDEPVNAEAVDASRGAAYLEKTVVLDCTAPGKSFPVVLDPGFSIQSVILNNQVLKPGKDYSADTGTVTFSFEPGAEVVLLQRGELVPGYTEARGCRARIVYELKAKLGEDYRDVHGTLFHRILKSGQEIQVVLDGFDSSDETNAILENIRVRFEKQSVVRGDESTNNFIHITTEYILTGKMSLTVAAGSILETQEITRIDFDATVQGSGLPEGVTTQSYQIEGTL